MIALTRRQADCLSYIRAYQVAHGFAPSFREIAAAIGVKSTSAVSRIVGGLSERGAVRRRYGRRHAVQIIEACICPHCGGQVRTQTIGG
jgi:repressor LexA